MNAQLPNHSDGFAVRLGECSRPYQDPMEGIPWDSLDPERPWLPEHLLSLYGLPEFEALSAADKVRLSQCEFVALCELGLWLEAMFIQRLGQHTLAQLHGDPHAYTYRLHELREEAGHSLMFLEIQKRAQIPFMTPPKHRPRLAQAFARFAPQGATAFVATILIGEEVPDRLNRRIYADKGLPPAVLAVTQVHMRDEARHMAFARATIQRQAATMPAWRRRLMSPLLREVIRQFLQTCFYPAPQVYAAAGLEHPARWAGLARRNPARAQLVRDCAEPSREFLRTQGFQV